MDYRADPAGVFPSDAHRHVLGHLSLPDEEFGWSPTAVHGRLQVLEQPGDAAAILDELVASGDAEESGGVYRMTTAGLAKLTGPNANEPSADDEPLPAPTVPFGLPRLTDGTSSTPVGVTPQPFTA